MADALEIPSLTTVVNNVRDRSGLISRFCSGNGISSAWNLETWRKDSGRGGVSEVLGASDGYGDISNQGFGWNIRKARPVGCIIDMDDQVVRRGTRSLRGWVLTCQEHDSPNNGDEY